MVAQNTVMLLTVVMGQHRLSPVASCEMCVELQRITLWVSVAQNRSYKLVYKYIRAFIHNCLTKKCEGHCAFKMEN